MKFLTSTTPPAMDDILYGNLILVDMDNTFEKYVVLNQHQFYHKY